MKILSVLGSSNRDGGTAKLLKTYMDGVVEHRNCDVEEVNLSHVNISPCTECQKCKTAEIKRCVIQDDMQDLYDKLKDIDALVLATPVHWFSMSAQLKCFIDRLYGFENKKILKDKKLVLLKTYEALDEEASGAKNVTNMFTSISNYLDMNFVHDIGLSMKESVLDKAIQFEYASKLGSSL